MDRKAEIKTRLGEIAEATRVLAAERNVLRDEMAQLLAAQDGRFSVGSLMQLTRGKQVRTVIIERFAMPRWSDDAFLIEARIVRKDGTHGDAFFIESYDFRGLAPIEPVQGAA